MKPIIGITPSPSEDEFSHGLFHRYALSSNYTEAIEAAGGVPLIIPPQQENIEEILSVLDGLLLSGGGDIDPVIYGDDDVHEKTYGIHEGRDTLEMALTKAAALAPPMPSLHDLRHSHASMLIALDVPLVDVQRRLGHRKPDTTLRVYAHQWKEREARRSQVGRQLGQLFEERKQLPAPSEARLALPPASPATTTGRRSGDHSGTDRGA